jgi:uncharacterized membrane protein
VIITTGLLVLAGFGISLYLTIAHFAGTQSLACSDNGIVNCVKVTTSPQSVVFGIPVAILGLGYFVVAMFFYSPWAWLSARRTIHLIRVGLAVAGMLFVLWLIAAELLIIKSICLWCTGVHVVTFVLFVITLTTAPALLEKESAS